VPSASRRSRLTAADLIDGALREAIESRRVPGVVAAVTGRDEVLYRAAFGVAETSTGRPMRVDDVFRIASMTKVVTSLGVMMLIDEGRLTLDGALADYLPGYRQPDVLESFDAATGRYTVRPAGSQITIRQLLTHTGGYGYWFLDPPLKHLTTGAPELFDPPFLIAEPGLKFAYSVATDVLGLVVPAVSGVGLAEFLAERIFEPLGIRDTGYALPPDVDRLPAVHARRSDGFEELPKERTAGVVRGGGGLYSTADDYLRLLRLFINDGVGDGRRLASAETIAAMRSNQIGELIAVPQRTAFPARANDFIFMDGTQKFGFGFMIEMRDQHTGRAAGSYGWAGILNTYFWIDPAAEIAAILLMQTSPFSDPISIDLYRRFERAVYDALGR
jgi:methyl acetate hydrolase